MLYYVPLESYEERYTMQWSAPITGWLERNWIKADIRYARIDSTENRKGVTPITTGGVLDTLKRNRHCCDQVNQLMALASTGVVTSKDIIYFDDFWHFNMQALAYHFHQLGITPKMFAFCHAQSVDEFDFTYPMRHWMRNFEKGIGKILDGIFVNCDVLRNLLQMAEIGVGKIHVTGHVFCEEEVEERMPKAGGGKSRAKFERKNHILFTSRWDTEKNPDFFLRVAEQLLRVRKDLKFIICTSAKRIESNDVALERLLLKKVAEYPGNIILKEGLTKEEYYEELCKAKIQLNTADQDFTSIALLEASVAGCYPLYPNFRSFPQAFKHMKGYMYHHQDLEDCVSQINWILAREKNWSGDDIKHRAWIHKRHNTSWARMINIMFGKKLIEVVDYE